MKRVLIVTSLFPPAGGPGAKRMSQFVKNLQPLGWEPIVLTHKYFFMGYDEKSLEQIPGDIKVHRTRSLEQYLRSDPKYVSDSRPEAVTQKVQNVKKGGIVRFLKNIIGAPDSGMLWMPFALWRGVQIFTESRYEVIFATGPPFSSFLIGVGLKCLTRRPLVLDFRDAWVASHGGASKNNVKLLLNRAYEKIAVRFADSVIANTGGVQKDFFERYPAKYRSKFVVIPNGYDEKDIVTTQPTKLKLDKSKFNIVHTGSLGGIRNPKVFLQAISELIDEGVIDPNLIRVHFVGLISSFEDGMSVESYRDLFHLEKQLNITGFVCREDAFSFNFEADVLLLVIGVVRQDYLLTYGLSGKVYDYVLTGKPILALAQKGGSTYELLRSHNIGVIADPLNVRDVKERTLVMYNDWLKGDLESNYTLATLQPHNMKNLTSNLSELLDSVTQPGNYGSPLRQRISKLNKE